MSKRKLTFMLFKMLIWIAFHICLLKGAKIRFGVYLLSLSFSTLDMFGKISAGLVIIDEYGTIIIHNQHYLGDNPYHHYNRNISLRKIRAGELSA